MSLRKQMCSYQRRSGQIVSHLNSDPKSPDRQEIDEEVVLFA